MGLRSWGSSHIHSPHEQHRLLAAVPSTLSLIASVLSHCVVQSWISLYCGALPSCSVHKPSFMNASAIFYEWWKQPSSVCAWANVTDTFQIASPQTGGYTERGAITLIVKSITFGECPTCPCVLQAYLLGTVRHAHQELQWSPSTWTWIQSQCQYVGRYSLHVTQKNLQGPVNEWHHIQRIILHHLGVTSL